MGRRRRTRVDPTHEWEQIELLCAWKEQREYERIRPLVLFGEPVLERTAETGTSGRTLYRRIAAFRDEGMASLFATPRAKRKVLPQEDRGPQGRAPAAEPRGDREHMRHPFRPQARRAHREGRPGGVRHPPQARGWSDKGIARYMEVVRSTVYRVRRRFEREGEEGPRGKRRGRPKGVAKVDLRAMNEVRKMQANPELGEFRVHAALERMGIHLSPRTVGRILAANREAEGLE